jgi:hypothetical protein
MRRVEQSMAVRDLTPTPRACRACGAYGNSQHRPTCQPGRRFKLGRMRCVQRDSHNSHAALSNARVQSAMIRGLGSDDDRPGGPR